MSGLGWVTAYALIGYVLALVMTPPTLSLSERIGAIDVPKDWRRMHTRSIPRGGGIALYFASVLPIALSVRGDPFLLSCFLGGGVMLLVGLWDDVLHLGAWSKLLLQILTVSVTLLGGGAVEGGLFFPSLIWILLLINAHNFIDGMDGLFSGCGGIEASALAIILAFSEDVEGAAAAASVAGACFGFRVFNRHPARVFAGDCGSECVGFLLGMLSLRQLDVGKGIWNLLPILLIFGYPITDLVTAVLRRLLRGGSPFAADRGHLHHRLFAAGLTQTQCVGILLSVSGMLCACGVLACFSVTRGFAAAACAGGAIYLGEIRRYVLKKGIMY